MTTWLSRTHPSPIVASRSTMEKGPMTTPRPMLAVGSTTARGWICTVQHLWQKLARLPWRRVSKDPRTGIARRAESAGPVPRTPVSAQRCLSVRRCEQFNLMHRLGGILLDFGLVAGFRLRFRFQVSALQVTGNLKRVVNLPRRSTWGTGEFGT